MSRQPTETVERHFMKETSTAVIFGFIKARKRCANASELRLAGLDEYELATTIAMHFPIYSGKTEKRPGYYPEQSQRGDIRAIGASRQTSFKYE